MQNIKILTILCRKPINPKCHFQSSISTIIDSPDETYKKPVLPKKPRSKGEPLKFADYKKVVCMAGNGGDGLISFLREKNVEFGGPDGGNGGNGGHVIFKADAIVSDLSHVNSFIKAKNGIPVSGMEKCCHGKNGEHLYISVPLNTLIKKPSTDELRPSKEILWELKRHGEMYIAARGGAGGHGNSFYLSNMVRKPLKAEEGGRGEKLAYDIEMGLVATAGFVGFPNVGKSTLLRAISRAKPKVTCYPFSTLLPSIGMVQYNDCFQVPVADIPGLVKGAHRNKGLGFSFLRHIVRCECILYVLDITNGPLKCLRQQWETLRNELNAYDNDLMKKESAIVINKIDTIYKEDKDEIENLVGELFPDQKIFLISGRKRENLDNLLMFLRKKHERFIQERKSISDEEENS